MTLITILCKHFTKTAKKVLDKKRLDAFSEICTYFLDQHAPRRKRCLKSNYKPFMNNKTSKAIMTRNRLRNRFLKNRNNLLRKQRNLCVSLLRKYKKKNFSKLNEKQITDNKRYWKTVKLFLSNKAQSSERINLTEKMVLY